MCFVFIFSYFEIDKSKILKKVEKGGDEALLNLVKKFDGINVKNIEELKGNLSE